MLYNSSLQGVIMNINILASLFLIVGIFLLMFSVNSFKKLNNLLILIFSLMTFGMSIFSFGYSWELFSMSQTSSLLAIKSQYLGLSFLSIYWAIISYKFRYNKYPHPTNIAFFLIIPVFVFFMVLTNELHHLYYKSITFTITDKHYLAHLEKGTIYYIFTFYSYGILLFLIYSFFYSLKYNDENKRSQSKLMLIGSTFPVIFNILYMFNLTPYNIDFTALGFLIFSFFWFIAINKYEYLDIKEITRIAAFEEVSEGVFILDTKDRIVDFNHFASRQFEIFSSKNIGKKISMFKMGKTILQNNSKNYFEIAVEVENKTYLYEFKKSPIYFRNTLIAYIYLFSDITNTKTLITDLTFLATHDFLTGSINRMEFIKIAEKELNRTKRYGGNLSIVMIDLDHFKNINDTYGHGVGDEILKGFVKLINEKIRIPDTLARLGGEEFCIILPETNLISSLKFAEKIRTIVEEKIFIINYNSIKITISLGIAYYSSQMSPISLKELLALADKALYISKETGRNKTSYLKQENEVGDLNEYN